MIIPPRRRRRRRRQGGTSEGGKIAPTGAHRCCRCTENLSLSLSRKRSGGERGAARAMQLRRKYRAAAIPRETCFTSTSSSASSSSCISPLRRVFRLAARIKNDGGERERKIKALAGGAARLSARSVALRERVNLCNETMGDVRFQGTGMEKENSASGGGGGGGGGGGAEAAAAATPGATSTSEKLQADQANPLLDPTALFGGKSFSLVLLLFPFRLFFPPVFFLSLSPRVPLPSFLLRSSPRAHFPVPVAVTRASRERVAISDVVMRNGAEGRTGSRGVGGNSEKRAR